MTSTEDIQHVALLFLLAFLLSRHARVGVSKTHLPFFLDTCNFYLVWPASFPSCPRFSDLTDPVSCKLRTKFCNYPDETIFLPRWAVFSPQLPPPPLPSRSVITMPPRAFFITSSETSITREVNRDSANRSFAEDKHKMLCTPTWRLVRYSSLFMKLSFRFPLVLLLKKFLSLFQRDFGKVGRHLSV